MLPRAGPRSVSKYSNAGLHQRSQLQSWVEMKETYERLRGGRSKMRVLVKSLGPRRKSFNCGGSASKQNNVNCKPSTPEDRENTKDASLECSREREVSRLHRQTSHALRFSEENCHVEYLKQKNPVNTLRGCELCATQESSRGCHQLPQIFSPEQRPHSCAQLPNSPTPRSVSFNNEQFKSRCSPTLDRQQQIHPRTGGSRSTGPHSSVLHSQFSASQTTPCQVSPLFHPIISNAVPPCSKESCKAPTRHSRHSDSCEQCSPCSRSTYMYSALPHQRHMAPTREELPTSSKGQCPCGSSSEVTHVDHFADSQFDSNCNRSNSSGHPCRCKCQSSKGFHPGGGCGGQSCGGIYSCAGSGGGTCCFPRNTKRRSGPECCGGGNCGCNALS